MVRSLALAHAAALPGHFASSVAPGGGADLRC